MKNDLFKDFDIFSRALVLSNDADPLYPVIKDILKYKPHYQPEFFTFCYVAFYSIESAIIMCEAFPTIDAFYGKKGDKTWFDFLEMRESKVLSKFGHERRGSCRNVKNQALLFKAATDFIENDLPKLEKASNLDFRLALQRKPWHGEWASFKIAEIFEKSLGWKNLEIKDLGLDGRDPNSNDGPIGGLRWLFGRDIKFDKSWFKTWNRFGEELSKAYDFDIGEVETMLCKFHKLVSGKYFVSHDIQELIELKHVLDKETYFKIMAGNFDKEFWSGKEDLEKHHRGHYAKTGEVLYSKYGKRIEPIDVADIILSL